VKKVIYLSNVPFSDEIWEALGDRLPLLVRGQYVLCLLLACSPLRYLSHICSTSEFVKNRLSEMKSYYPSVYEE
jgi:hypothetical protein